MANCYCGNDADFSSCCKPYIDGSKNTPTAEATMRARYSAYVTGDTNFIVETLDPQDREDFDIADIESWSKSATWLGLEVLSANEGEEVSEVEFKAHYEMAGQKLTHHELSTFQKIDGKWYFIDGEVFRDPIQRSEKKVGRNDPCTCGSGKKYKKCCMR